MRVLRFPFPMLLSMRPYAFSLSRFLTVFCLNACAVGLCPCFSDTPKLQFDCSS